MNVVFVTVNDYTHLPIFFSSLLSKVRDQDAVRCVIVPPLYKGQSTLSASKKFITTFGPKEFALTAAEIVSKKILARINGLLGLSRAFSVEDAFASFGCEVHYEDGDINGLASLRRLRNWKPDLIVSISCTQIFGRELLQLPARGCLNLHGAPLPRYRGVYPSFWMLKHGETEGGITLFFMNELIDGGHILIKERIPIHPYDSLRSYIRRSKLLGADIVAKGIEKVRCGNYASQPMPQEDSSYFGWPSRSDVREFMSSGKRLR